MTDIDAGVNVEMALEVLINTDAEIARFRKLDIVTELDPIITSTPSALKFRKLGESLGLIVHAQGSLFHVEEELYASKGKGHNVGDVKAVAHDARMFSITLTNGEDFAAQFRWYETFPKDKPSVFKFDSAHIGGPRTKYPKGERGYISQITKAMEEVKSCFTK